MRQQNTIKKTYLQNFPYNWAHCIIPIPPNVHNSFGFFNYQEQNPFCSNIPKNTHFIASEVPQTPAYQNVVKIEERAPEQVNPSKSKRVSVPKYEPQLIKIQKISHIHVNPKPEVHHTVRYFDPSAAPPLTSKLYNIVNDKSLDKRNSMRMNNAFLEQLNQLNFPEGDSQPFIVFKYRRIKKKYRRFIDNTGSNLSVAGHQIDSNFDSEDIPDAQSASIDVGNAMQQNQVLNNQYLEIAHQNSKPKINNFPISNMNLNNSVSHSDLQN